MHPRKIIEDGKIPVGGFDDRRATFDPVTAIIIGDAADFADRGAMNVPAQNSMGVVALGIMSDRRLEFANEAHRILDPALGIRAKRPVTQTEPSPNEIDERIQ